MYSINFRKTYYLGDSYDEIKNRAFQKLEKYWSYPNLIIFNDEERNVTFTTERLIPKRSKNRPTILLLFSNPHPHSINQGMFLSRNTKGQKNLFWPVMKRAGWFSIPDEEEYSNQLAEILILAEHGGPFDLIFYCYYAFPTDYPKDIKKIFGRTYFNQHIEIESADEFLAVIRKTEVEAVVSFNKGIFNHLALRPVVRYINALNNGELIQSHIKSIDRIIPIFLTYPTGWRYHRDYMQLRISNLDKIKSVISSGIVKDK